MSLVSRNSTLVLLPVLCGGVIAMNAPAAGSALSLKERFADPPAEYRVTLNGPQALDYANEKIAGGFLLGGWFPSPQAKGNIDPAWMDNPELFKQLSRRIYGALGSSTATLLKRSMRPLSILILS